MDHFCRKFAVHIDPREASFEAFLTCCRLLRALKNVLITRIIAVTTAADFRYSGKVAAKILYDQIKDPVCSALPRKFSQVKERTRRNAFFEVYDQIRNGWVRNGWLEQLLRFFMAQSPQLQQQFLQNTLTYDGKVQIYQQLQHRYTRAAPEFSMAYLENLIGELRHRIIALPEFNHHLWETMSTLQQHPTWLDRSILTQGWKAVRDHQPILLQGGEILTFLLQSYKRKTSYYINKQGNPHTLKATRDSFLVSLDLEQWDIQALLEEGLQAEFGTWTRATCLNRVLKPSFTNIPQGEFTIEGFHQYLVQKCQYHARSQLAHHPDSSLLALTLRSTNQAFSFPNLIQRMLTDLETQVTSPLVKKLTWTLKFSEQLYQVHVQASSTGTEQVTLHFTPFLHHPGFTFRIHPKTIARLQEASPSPIALSTLLKTVPVVQIEGRKVIINQPLPMAMEDSTPDPISPSPDGPIIRGMGVDLGLKHFAVLSIWEWHQVSGEKTEIGRYFLDQRTVLGCRFDPAQLRFLSPSHRDYNLKRRLEHLRAQQRALSHILSQMKLDGGEYRTIRYFYLQKRRTYIWEKVRRIHQTLSQQIAHVIIQICRAYHVTHLMVEDLRWSQHSRRETVGRWLSHNQQHFLHSQIITRLGYMGQRSQVKVKQLNPRWSSQIAWTVQAAQNLRMSLKTRKETILPYLGTRTGKHFRYRSPDGYYSWQGDSDLNAARNMALRGLVMG